MCADVASWRPGPAGTRFASVARFADIDSTNRFLLDEARSGGPDGLVAVADHQRAGRGRLGRRWEAPPGANLLVSILLRPQVDPDDLHRSTTAVALAAADACREVADVDPGLKWPNDLVVGGGKLAGVLSEADGGALVVGLGVNVRWPGPGSSAPVPPEDEVAMPATSLWLASGVRHDPTDLVDPLLIAAERRLADLATSAGRRRQADDYRRSCVTLGRDVLVTLADGSFSGAAVDVTDDGHLVVREGGAGAGVDRVVTAGDVVHVRLQV